MIRGIRKAHFVALISSVILCLVVATAAAPAQVTSKVTVKDCTPVAAAFVAKCFQITTSPAASVVINTGTDKRYTIGTIDRLRGKHVVWVRGLSPNTPYYAQVVAKNKAGKTVKSIWSAFKTAAPGSAPATVTTRGNKLLLNGQPFFASAAGFSSPCLDEVAYAGLRTMNVFVVEDRQLPNNDPAGDKRCKDPDATKWNDPSTWSSALHAGLNNAAWWTEDSPQKQSELKSQGLPELMQWSANDTKPSWKDYSDDPCSSTTGFFTAANALSKTKAVVMEWGVPAFNAPNEKGCTTASLARLKFWSTVAAGGKGVRWFPEDFQSYFDVLTDVQKLVGVAIHQLAAIGPAVISGTKIPVNFDVNGYVRIGAWRYGKDTIIIAVNTKRVPVNASFSSDLFKTKTAQVFWENRTAKVSNGTVTDSFAAQGVHIYKMAEK